MRLRETAKDFKILQEPPGDSKKLQDKHIFKTHETLKKIL